MCKRKRGGLDIGQVAHIGGDPSFHVRRVRPGLQHLFVVVGLQKDGVGAAQMFNHVFAVYADVRHHRHIPVGGRDGKTARLGCVVRFQKRMNAEAADLHLLPR